MMKMISRLWLQAGIKRCIHVVKRLEEESALDIRAGRIKLDSSRLVPTKILRVMRLSVLKRFAVPSLLSALPFAFIFIASTWAKTAEHGHLVAVGSMHEIRAGHTATVLQDGTVLIAGGFKKGPDGHSQIYSRTVELFDPKTRSFVTTGNMNLARAGHTATLLSDGRVLIAGGFTGKGVTQSAEVYDPTMKSFTLLSPMSVARGAFTATRLPNGDVLLAGGGDQTATATAELFHSSTNRFTVTGSMTVPRMAHTATLLLNGKVLIAGGGNNRMVYASTELYNPATGMFSPSGTMNAPRYKHAAILLKDGHTLILGGSDVRDWQGKYQSAEIYDSRAERFTAIPDMISPRFKFPAAVVELSTGSILICGGSKPVEIFDFFTKRFEEVASFTDPHYYGTASCLKNHSILIVGGYTDNLQATDGAWLYTE